jgi:hypothetical protein
VTGVGDRVGEILQVLVVETAQAFGSAPAQPRLELPKSFSRQRAPL